MVSQARPNFLDSEWLDTDKDGNWRLRKGAPQEIVDEFNEYMDGDEEEVPNTKTNLTEDDFRDL